MKEFIADLPLLVAVSAPAAFTLGFMMRGLALRRRVEAARAEGAMLARTSVDGDSSLAARVDELIRERNELKRRIGALTVKPAPLRLIAGPVTPSADAAADEETPDAGTSKAEDAPGTALAAAARELQTPVAPASKSLSGDEPDTGVAAQATPTDAEETAESEDEPLILRNPLPRPDDATEPAAMTVGGQKHSFFHHQQARTLRAGEDRPMRAAGDRWLRGEPSTSINPATAGRADGGESATDYMAMLRARCATASAPREAEDWIAPEAVERPLIGGNAGRPDHVGEATQRSTAGLDLETGPLPVPVPDAMIGAEERRADATASSPNSNAGARPLFTRVAEKSARDEFATGIKGGKSRRQRARGRRK